jgi:hypothetical protein
VNASSAQLAVGARAAHMSTALNMRLIPTPIRRWKVA